MMDDLPIDTLVEIASKDRHVWVKLQRANKRFYSFSVTPYGIALRDRYFAQICSGVYHTTYLLFGRPHRDNDLPARVWNDGGLDWYQRGRLHRDNDLPAAITARDSKFWYQNGSPHRDEGPAVIYGDGGLEFWQHGIRCDPN